MTSLPLGIVVGGWYEFKVPRWKVECLDEDLVEDLAKMTLRDPDPPLLALHARGFLARRLAGEIEVPPCSAAVDDLAVLSAAVGTSCECGRAFGSGQLSPAGRVHVHCTECFVRRVLQIPWKNHPTSDLDHGWRSRSYEGFLQTRYGARVPVRGLEPGVALLVKALALIGAYTIMSCDGHGDRNAWIRLHSRHDLRWVGRAVAGQVAGPSVLRWELEVGRWNHAIWRFDRSTRIPMRDAWSTVAIARGLIARAPKIRAEKQALREHGTLVRPPQRSVVAP